MTYNKTFLLVLGLFDLFMGLLLSGFSYVPYYENFKNPKEWNDGAVETHCLILSHFIEIIEEKDNLRYNGYINVSYSIKDSLSQIDHINQILIYKEEDQEYDVIGGLQSNFQTNTTINCYYQKRSPSEMKVKLNETTLLDFIIVICIGAILIVLGILILIIRYFYY